MTQKEYRRPPYRRFLNFMKDNGIKQREVACLLGKGVSALNQNLNGTGGDLTVSEVGIICKQYGISADTYFLCL